jgi:hypothetical protein
MRQAYVVLICDDAAAKPQRKDTNYRGNEVQLRGSPLASHCHPTFLTSSQSQLLS